MKPPNSRVLCRVFESVVCLMCRKKYQLRTGAPYTLRTLCTGHIVLYTVQLEHCAPYTLYALYNTPYTPYIVHPIHPIYRVWVGEKLVAIVA